jgi:hypothetical protein
MKAAVTAKTVKAADAGGSANHLSSHISQPRGKVGHPQATAAKARQEVLAPNAFIGKKEPPTEAELASALGPAKPLWDQVLCALMAESPELVPEWKCSAPKLGWGLRLQQKKRNIIHFSPCAGSFRVAFIFGERALEAVREAFKIPARQKKAEWGTRILDLIGKAPKYAEGTGIRIEVTAKDVSAICTLAKIKMEN